MATVGEKIRSNIKRNVSRGTGVSRSTSSSSTSSYDPRKQVANYQKRLAALGISDEEATDTRNPLEKLLNLEKDQNVLFDIFEILNRPQNALFSGIAEAQEGGDFLEGAKAGITGNRKTTGKNILVNAGMDDTEGQLDLSDVLGFGLDVVADPMNIPLIPSAGKLVSGSQWVANKTGNLAKGTAKLADKGIEKALDAMDSSATKQIQNLVDKGVDAFDAQRAVGKSTNKLQTYRDLKTGVQRIFDSSKNVKGLVGKGREADNLKNMEKLYGEALLDDIKNTAQRIAKNGKGDYDKVYNALIHKLSDAVEANADWSLKGSDVIKQFNAGRTADFFTETQAKAIKDELSKFDIKTTLENGRKLTLDSKGDIKKLSTLANTEFVDKAFGRKMSDETFNELNAIRNYFENTSNPEVKELYNKANDALSSQAKLSGSIRGINPENMITEGHVRHNLNADVPRSQMKAFNTRKYDMPLREANKIKQAELETKIASTSEGIKKLQSQIYEVDDKGGLILDAAGNPKRNDNVYESLVASKESYIKKLEESKASYKELLKSKAGLEVDPTKLNETGKKALKTIGREGSLDDELRAIEKEINGIDFKKINPENTEAIKNVLDDYNEYTKKVTGLKNYAAKSNVDEVGGLYKRKEQVKGIYENIKTSKKKLTASMTEARALSNDTNRNLIKEANKSVKAAFEKGKKYASKDARLATTSDKINKIYQTSADMVDSLTKKINYEKTALANLKEAGADTVFKQKLDRIGKMSEALDVLSSKSGKEFFTTAFDTNFADYVRASSDYAAGAQKFNDALVSGVFTDPTYVKTIDNLVDENSINKLMKEGYTRQQAIRKINPKIPYGFEKVKGSYLAKRLDAYKGILSEEGKALIGDVEKYIGSDLYIDKDLVNMLDVGTKVVSNETNPLLKLWDGMNNTFKKFTTLSPGFQMRNIIGNSTDMALSGMPASQMPKYYKEAASLLNDYQDLAKKAVEGSLDTAEKVKWDALVDFNRAGFDNAYASLQNLDTLKLDNQKNPINWVTQKSMDLNERMDKWNRMTLYLYAKDNPNYMAKLGVKSANDAVRKVLFDPSNMSDFESKVAKRIIPFYTFTKQNLMFQMDNLMRNTPRYKRLFNAINSIYNNLDENQYYAYQKEGMQIPLPFTFEDGNQLFLKTNLPVSDLGEWMSKPLQRAVSSTAPLMRTPFELVTGVDTFTGQDSNYKAMSNLVETATGKPLNSGVKNLSGKAEQILAGLGVSNISTNLVKKVTAILKRNNGNMDDQAMWAEIFRSIVQNTNQETIETSRAYDDLELYQQYIKSLKNQGINVPTVTELNNQSKRTLRKAKSRRAKLNGFTQ